MRVAFTLLSSARFRRDQQGTATSGRDDVSARELSERNTSRRVRLNFRPQSARRNVAYATPGTGGEATHFGALAMTRARRVHTAKERPEDSVRANRLFLTACAGSSDPLSLVFSRETGRTIECPNRCAAAENSIGMNGSFTHLQKFSSASACSSRPAPSGRSAAAVSSAPQIPRMKSLIASHW
jgi:hypothetical protein